MSVEVMELFNIFSKTYTREEAQTIVKDIETLISDHKHELARKTDILEVKGDIREVELKLTKEIEAVKLEVEKAKSSTIKWVVGWMVGLLVAQTGTIIAIFTLLK